MKLLRFGPKGQEKPGLLDEEGRIRDLSEKINDIDGAFLASERLAQIAKLETDSLPLIEGTHRLGPPGRRLDPVDVLDADPVQFGFEDIDETPVQAFDQAGQFKVFSVHGINPSILRKV